jgi:hypothetical protein
MDFPDDYNPDTILADHASHPIHRMYAAINVGIRDRGEHWSKCHDCGIPYQLTEEWGSTTACSPACLSAYIAYVESESAQW